MLTSLPFGAFLFLIGLFWVTQPVQPPDEAADDPEAAEKDYRQARRRLAMIGVLRIILAGIGILIMLGNLIAGPGSLKNLGSFALLTGIYGLLLLMVQRSERNRRLATLAISLLLWLIVIPRYAEYRGWEGESNWGIYLALLLNYGFWLLIGRHYPPHSSQEIFVWGMDD